MPGMPIEMCTPMRPAESLARPIFEVPAGACDSHIHVFGSRDRYPSIPAPNYTLPDGGLKHYQNLMPALGISNFVIVQPSFYGVDNTCLLDALVAADGVARGVVVIEPDHPLQELVRFNDLGVRGVRLDLSKRAALPAAEIQDYIRTMAAKVKLLGWHLQLYAPGAVIREQMAFLRDLDIDFVIDHMGCMLEKDGLTDGDFQSLLQLLQNGRGWVKLSAPYRLARLSSEAAVDGMAELIVRAAPHKILWGSDWPHIPDGDRDTGELLNLLAKWAPKESDRIRILVQNPRELFDFS